MADVNCSESFRGTCCRLRFLYNLESDGLHGSQSFVARFGNLRRWQEEAVLPAVLELEREGVFNAEVVGPVVRTTRSQVCKAEDAC